MHSATLVDGKQLAALWRLPPGAAVLRIKLL